jgi:hypothetical protein
MGRRDIAPVFRKSCTTDSKECLDLRSGHFTYRQRADSRHRRQNLMVLSVELKAAEGEKKYIYISGQCRESELSNQQTSHYS